MNPVRYRNLVINKKLSIAYELIMATLALVVVAILVIEFTRPLTPEQTKLLAKIDISILIVFAIDYFYRFFSNKNKWQFFKSNIFDLIAIIPFDKAFRIARLARLVRLLRFTRLTKAARLGKLARIILLLRKSFATLKAVLLTNGLIYIIMITGTLILFGALSIMSFEPGMKNFGDALWWSLVTTTTVGYGDISPATTGGRVVAGVLMITGIGFLGMVTGSIATYFVGRLSKNEEQDKLSVADEQIKLIKSKLGDIENLSQEDVQLINQMIWTVWESKREFHKTNVK